MLDSFWEAHTPSFATFVHWVDWGVFVVVAAVPGVGWESTLPAVDDHESGHLVVDERYAAEHSTGSHRVAEGKRPVPDCTQLLHTPGGIAASAFAQHCTEDELPLPPEATNRRCWLVQSVATQARPFSDGCCWDCTPVAVAAAAPAVAAAAPAAEGVAGSWSNKCRLVALSCVLLSLLWWSWWLKHSPQI